MRFLCCLLLTALAPFASPQTQDRYAQLVEQLDNPSFVTRTEATEALISDTSLTPQIVAGLLPEEATPEQRNRLENIARHHAIRLDRDKVFQEPSPGSLGIVHSVHLTAGDDEHTPTNYSLVSRVLPGFPAYGKLRPLDRIVAIDGQALTGPPNADQFEQLMRRYRSGQTLTLTVERGEQTFDLILTLAQSNALRQMYAVPDFGLAEPYRDHWHLLRDELFPSR